MLRLFIIICLLLPALARADRITIFAAASLKAPLDEIAQRFGHDTGHQVVVSYAASSVLARQIAQGAPADVYISANQAWMEYLAHQGIAQDVVTIAGNTLVLAATRPAAPLALAEDAILQRLGNGGRIAVPLVNAVPLGQYAAQALEHLNLLTALTPHLAQMDNARSAAITLQRNEVPLAILYASDMVALPDLQAVARFDPASHAPVRYQATAITKGPAQGFVDMLTGPGQQVLQSHGFTAP